MSEEKRKRLAEGIARAATTIEGRGWCIGGMEDASGRICMMGAVRESFMGDSRQMKYWAYDAVNRALGQDMTEWNDRHDERGVVTMLRRIAGQIDPKVPIFETCLHGVRICPSCDRPAGCEECTRSKSWYILGRLNLIDHAYSCRFRGK